MTPAQTTAVTAAPKGGLARLRLPTVRGFALPPALLKSLMPVVVLAIGLTALVLMFLWHDEASYKPVFGAREKVAAAEMMATLDAEHVPYRVHPDSGQVLVPEAMLGKVRMLLAAKGVTAKLPAGLELMDRNDPLGVSQFVQDVRFRRGLEGELSQSIGTLDAIDAARVHLSIAKSSSFVANDGEKSSASVVLTLKAGRTLAPEQIAAIVSMVAGSVASLEPQRVSLVDQAGNLLSAHVDLTEGFDAATAGGSDSARHFQDETRRNVHDLLAPVLGENNFKVSVTAAVDTDRIEETVEKYGDSPKVTSEAMRDEQDKNRMALGVPGSLSNRPVAVTSPAPGASSADDAGGNRKNATTRQYAYDRSITQIKRGRGQLKKLNVAVLLNSTAAPGAKADGWSTEALGNVEKLLRNGLGIDAQRGDTLVVSALPFPAAPPVAPWWQQRDNIVDGAGWLAYAIGALLGFFIVVRPLMKLVRQALVPRRGEPATAGAPVALTAHVGAAPVAAMAALPGAAAAAGGAAAMPVVPLLENYDLPPPGSPVDVMVEHLKVLAGKEPERVAEVVKGWVQKNGRAE
jgi:flagellar M-ring protein FliF